MTSRERVYAAFDGEKLDCFPVTVPYIHLMYREHWHEITGLPLWDYDRWRFSEPDEHVQFYLKFNELLPFDFLHPLQALPRNTRSNMKIAHRDNAVFVHNKKMHLYKETTKEAVRQYAASEKREVWNKGDVDRLVKVTPAEKMIEKGVNDYRKEAVETLGNEKFIVTGGVVSTFYQCSNYVGLTNLFILIHDEPQLIHYLSQKILNKNLETIEVLAASGGDAIFIDDAMTTADLISVDAYREFSLPYTKQMVSKAHSLGLKVIMIYFGHVADRIEEIISLGADALSMETSMKGYVNDLAEIAGQINNRTCVFGNLDPVGVLQNGDDELVRREVCKQIKIGEKYGRFVTSTGSPVTPSTPLSRIRQYIDIARSNSGT